jgi:soluble lytic murein transglycosylase-like protein
MLLWLLLPIGAALAYFATVKAGGNDPSAIDAGATVDTLDWGIPQSVADSASAVMSAVTGTAKKIFTPPAAATPYLDTIAQAERANAIPDTLLARVLYQESRFRPDIVSGLTQSKTGAQGIAQFEPATAAQMGVDPLDPKSAINGAAEMLKRLYDKFGSWALALAAYNWGEGHVQRLGMAKAPPETVAYVSQILNDVSV